MSPPRTLLSLALLGLLTLSSALPHSTRSEDIAVAEFSTKIETRNFETGTLLDLVKRASVTCAKTDNGRKLTAQEEKDIKKLKDYRADLAAHPPKTNPNDGKQDFINKNKRRLDDLQAERARRNYAAHTYTENQAGAAMQAGVDILKKQTTLTPQQYPHKFKNNEGIPFDGGANRYEFPIKKDNSIAKFDENVNDVPDRVAFEWKAGTNAKLLGVIRHGPGGGFFKC